MRCEKCGVAYSAIIHITRVPFVGWLCIPCAEEIREKGGNAMLRYERYKRRFWAVYEDDGLLCVTVYLKGALSVIERITGVRPERPVRKKRAPLPPIYRPKPTQERQWIIHDR